MIFQYSQMKSRKQFLQKIIKMINILLVIKIIRCNLKILYFSCNTKMWLRSLKNKNKRSKYKTVLHLLYSI